MIERWVLDTNVVVSALLFRGQTSALHRSWRAGAYAPVASEAILSEFRRVLAYPMFRLSPEQAVAIVDQEVLPSFTLVPDLPGGPITVDPDDDKFLRVAAAAGAAALVTGDPHILSLRPTWSDVPILTVAEALDRLGVARGG